MQKDYYYLKEVLLGLKDEYIKMDEELKRLKQMAIVTNPRKIENYYFWLFQYNGKIELKCVVEREKNRLQKFIEAYQIKTGSFAYGRDNREIRMNEDGTFVIKEKDGLISGLTPEFGQQVKKILSSDFTTNIYQECIPSIEDEFYSIIEINHTDIHYVRSFGDDGFDLIYSPLTPNRIHFSRYDGEKFNEQLVHNILYSKYPRTNFPEYHQRIIDANPTAKKPIEILDVPTCLNRFGYISENMELDEKESVIVLKKVKKMQH